MKRLSDRWPLISMVLLLIAATAQAAPAKSKKKNKGADKVPVSAEISKSMGDLKWGMTEDELQKQLIGKVKEYYKPLIAKTKDGVEEDRLREKATGEIKRIKDSFVEFKGNSTGWDVSFLRGEFTHGNGESMLVMRDQNSQNFYFFMGGKLWKWYKAFDAEVFPADSFATFAAAVQRRFGPAKEARGELAPGSGERHWLEWQDDQSRLRAVDQTDFYGFYCLVFEQKSTVANLAQLRSNTRDVGNKQHAMIEAVTAKGGAGDPDSSPDIADRISGNTHAHAAPAASSSTGKGKKGSSKAESEPAAAAAPKGVKDDDDPLRGLGL
jgi:hypothetical protein